MHPLSLEDVVSVLAGPRQWFPDKAVLITFDDADRTLLDEGLPILARLKIPAVAFVIAGYLGAHRPFWWREVEYLIDSGATTPALNSEPERAVPQLKRMPDRVRRRTIHLLRRTIESLPERAEQLRTSDLRLLHDEGIAIGNHTMTHPLLDRCSVRRVRSEIQRAHRILHDAVGVRPVAFAYPNGNCHLEAIRILKELGYKAGFLFDHRVGKVPIPDPFRISRVRVGSHASLNRFRLIVSGLHPMIHHLLGRS